MSSRESSPVAKKPQTIKGPAKKATGKAKSTKKTVDEPRDEGEEPNLPFKAPEGATLVDHDVDAGEFDWDAVKNDPDVELWLIRVPEGLKPKYLENETLEIGPSSKNTQQIGTLERKHATYDIWALGGSDDQAVGGEETKTFSCLLPRKKKGGKLYRAPNPISRHILFSVQSPKPTGDNNASIYQNPPRFAYPKETLTHQFIPYGAKTTDPDAAVRGEEPEAEPATMEVDEPVVSKPAKEPKGKKRKVDDPTSPPVKKAKKAKTTA